MHSHLPASSSSDATSSTSSLGLIGDCDPSGTLPKPTILLAHVSDRSLSLAALSAPRQRMLIPISAISSSRRRRNVLPERREERMKSVTSVATCG